VTAIRAIAYETGIINSNIDTFPVPSYIWTGLFGIILGFCFILLYPIYVNQKKPLRLHVNLVLLTVGLCWILFNLFIAMIFAGALLEMFTRSVIDVLALFLASLLWYMWLRLSR
jgi:hypothetical protein